MKVTSETLRETRSVTRWSHHFSRLRNAILTPDENENAANHCRTSHCSPFRQWYVRVCRHSSCNRQQTSKEMRRGPQFEIERGGSRKKRRTSLSSGRACKFASSSQTSASQTSIKTRSCSKAQGTCAGLDFGAARRSSESRVRARSPRWPE